MEPVLNQHGELGHAVPVYLLQVALDQFPKSPNPHEPMSAPPKVEARPE